MRSSADVDAVLTAAPEVFVDREKELNLARERMRALLHSQHITEPVLYFYGAPLIGKSTLLRKIMDEAEFMGIPVGLADFEEFSGDEKNLEKSLAQNLWESMDNTAPVGAWDPLIPDDEADTAAKKLVAYARQLHEGALATPVVWLFDSLEKASPTLWQWVQEKLLIPALSDGGILVVIASRLSPAEMEREGAAGDNNRFRFSWSLVRRMKTIRMEAFDKDSTEELMIRLYNRASLVEKALPTALKWTGGVPGLVTDFPVTSYGKSSEIGKVLGKVLLGRLKMRSEEKAWALSAMMADFRHFGPSVIARVSWWQDKIETKPGKIEEEKVIRDGLDLIQRLRNKHMVEVHPDGYGYRIVAELRPVMRSYQLEMINREASCKLHVLALLYYIGEFEESGDFAVVADQMYHLAGAWNCSKEIGGFREDLTNNILRDYQNYFTIERTEISENEKALKIIHKYVEAEGKDQENRIVEYMREFFNKAKDRQGEKFLVRAVNKLCYVLKSERSDWEALLPPILYEKASKECQRLLKDIM